MSELVSNKLVAHVRKHPGADVFCLAWQSHRPYPQLNKLPQHSRTALEQVFGAARLANPCPERPQPAQALPEAPAAAMHGTSNGNGYTVSLPHPNGAPAGLPQASPRPLSLSQPSRL